MLDLEIFISIPQASISSISDAISASEEVGTGTCRDQITNEDEWSVSSGSLRFIFRIHYSDLLLLLLLLHLRIRHLRLRIRIRCSDH